MSTYIVSNGDDSGPGTLRECIMLANEGTGNTIIINVNVNLINTITIYSSMTLTGLNDTITITSSSSIFYIYGSDSEKIDVSINDITFTSTSTLGTICLGINTINVNLNLNNVVFTDFNYVNTPLGLPPIGIVINMFNSNASLNNVHMNNLRTIYSSLTYEYSFIKCSNSSLIIQNSTISDIYGMDVSMIYIDNHVTKSILNNVQISNIFINNPSNNMIIYNNSELELIDCNITNTKGLVITNHNICTFLNSVIDTFQGIAITNTSIFNLGSSIEDDKTKIINGVDSQCIVSLSNGKVNSIESYRVYIENIVTSNGNIIDLNYEFNLTNLYVTNCTSANGSILSYTFNGIDEPINLLLSNSIFMNNLSTGNAIIKCENQSSTSPPSVFTVSDCIIDGNDGTGIINNGVMSINSTQIHNCNNEFNVGGGILTNNSLYTSSTSINSVTITNCIAGNGGAMYCNGGSVVARNINIDNCSSVQFGGALYCNYGIVSIIDNSIINNCNGTGGINITVGVDCTVNVSDSKLITVVNVPEIVGSSIYNSGTINLSNCEIIGTNRCMSHISSSGAFLIQNSIIEALDTFILDLEACSSSTISYCSLISSKIYSTGVITGVSTIINGLGIEECLIGILSNENIQISNCTISNCDRGLIISEEKGPSNNISINYNTFAYNEYGIDIRTDSSVSYSSNCIGYNVVDLYFPTITITHLVSNGNNCISDDTGVLIFTDATDMNNTDPLLNELEYNGGICNTISMKFNSPLINNGNMDYIVGNYDNRGEGYNRILDGRSDIGAYQRQSSIICMKKGSKIKVHKSNSTYLVNIEDIRTDMKIVVNKKYYAKVIHNVVTGPTKKFVLINKNSIDVNVPFIDTYFTTGHVIVIDECEIKARDLQRTKGIGTIVYGFNEDVYTLVLDDVCYNRITDIREDEIDDGKFTINTNGITNIAFKISEWNEFVRTNSLVWRTI